MADATDGSRAATAGALTKGARITGDQRASLAEVFGQRYAGGESIRSIAQESGRSYGFVHGVLKESGASLRGRGGATRGPRRGPLEKLADRVDAATDGVASPARTKAKAGKKAEKAERAEKAGKAEKADRDKGRKDDKAGKKADAKKTVKPAKPTKPAKPAKSRKGAKKG